MGVVVELPDELVARARSRAAREGISLVGFLARAIERTLAQPEARSEDRPLPRLTLDVPLVPADGRKPFDLTNEQIYRLIELP